jgi:hypothetical protein
MIMIALFIYLKISSIWMNSQIQTIDLPDWKSKYSRNGLNNFCRFDYFKRCVGYCPITNSSCRIMTHFNQKVCGCKFCYFNNIFNKCFGQCSNTVLETCVSKVPIPTKNSHCKCASCKALWNIIETTKAHYNYVEDSNYFLEQQIPSCDDSTCYQGNSCSYYYFSKNRVLINDSLFCQCNNNNFKLLSSN